MEYEWLRFQDEREMLFDFQWGIDISDNSIYVIGEHKNTEKQRDLC